MSTSMLIGTWRAGRGKKRGGRRAGREFRDQGRQSEEQKKSTGGVGGVKVGIWRGKKRQYGNCLKSKI